jgi:hypothetical protein
MRKLLAGIVAAIILLSPLSALAQPLLGGSNTYLSNTLNTYISWGQMSGIQTNSNIANNIPIAAAGTASGLYINLSNAPIGGASYTGFLLNNGATSTVTCAITGSATQCTDLTHTLTIAAGDRPQLVMAPSGAPASAWVTWGLVFTPSVSNTSLLFGVGNGPSNSVNSYSSLVKNGLGFQTTESTSTQNVIPIAGTIANMYTQSASAPGTGKSYAYSLRDNNATTSLSATLSNLNTIVNDTTDSVAASAGDIVDIVAAPSGTPASPASEAMSFTFAPTVAGQFLYMAGTGAQENNNTTNYNPVSGGSSTATTTEQAINQIAPANMTITTMSVMVTTAPAGSRIFTLRDNGANTGLTCTVASSNACTANGSVTVTAGDLLDIKDVSSNAAASYIRTTLVANQYPLAPICLIKGGSVLIKGGSVVIK